MITPVHSGALVAAAVALGVLVGSGEALGGALGGERAAAPDPAPFPTVVELFTSQGCSSCPPADAYLGELSARDGIIALSFHVDYWNYIGWRDPFASADATARQRAYGRTLHDRYSYTPQMVINGMASEVGSRRARVDAIIARESRRTRLRVPVTAVADGSGRLTVTVPAAAYEGEAALWLIEFDREHVTDVARGENAGRKLRNVNVVREIHRIGTWSGEPLEETVDLDTLGPEPRGGCVVILQTAEAGPILGAAAVLFDRAP